jgi:hypothetical protein
MKRLAISLVVLCLADRAFASQAFWTSYSSPRNDGISYQGVDGPANYSFNPVNVREVLPGGGTVGKLYVWSAQDPGGSASWTVRLRKNGSNTQLWAKINSGETYDVNEVPGGVSFDAGDTVEYLITPSGSPTAGRVYLCLFYEPTTANHSYIMGCNAYWQTHEYPVAPIGTMVPNGDCRLVFPLAGTVHGLYGWLSAAPGSGDARALTTSLYTTSWAAQSQTISFGESDTSQSDTAHPFAVSAGNKVRVGLDITGTPATCYLSVSLDFSTSDGSFPLFWAMNAYAMDSDGYACPNGQGTGNATESLRNQMSLACTLKSLYVASSGSPGSLESFTFTVRDDATDTALTAAITGTGTTANYSTDVAVDANSALSIFIDLSSGASTTRKMFAGILVSLASAPGQATTPDPVDTGTGVSVSIDPSWTAGADATSHDVYFGTDFNDVNDANTLDPEFVGNQAGTTYDRTSALDPNATCYWRIDEKNAAGTTKGAVWSFTTALAENDFSTDGQCVAAWAFNTVGDLGKDTKGSNDLTNITGHEATADTSNKKEGTTAALFASATPSYMTISDSSLASGFPLKSGETNKKISVTFWCRPGSVPTAGNVMYLFSKWDVGNSKCSFAIALTEADGDNYITLKVGNNGGAGAENRTNLGVHISAGYWYHVTCTYDDSDKRFVVSVYDPSLNYTGSISGYLTYNISITDAPIYLGAYADLDGSYFNGRLDEVAVFNDILTVGEADQITMSTYTGPSTGGGGGSILRSVVE